jgi:excisionase family DNA binding protein
MNDEADERRAEASQRMYLTKKELAARTGLSPTTIQRYKKDRKLPFYQPGGEGAKLLFPPNAVEAALRQLQQEQEAVTSSASTARNGASESGRTTAVGRLSGPRPRWQTDQRTKEQR